MSSTVSYVSGLGSLWNFWINRTLQSDMPSYAQSCQKFKSMSQLSHVCSQAVCSGPPQSQSQILVLVTILLHKGHNILLRAQMSFAGVALCHNLVLGLDAILLHKIDDPS